MPICEESCNGNSVVNGAELLSGFSQIFHNLVLYLKVNSYELKKNDLTLIGHYSRLNFFIIVVHRFSLQK
jgi:hypothetical protein